MNQLKLKKDAKQLFKQLKRSGLVTMINYKRIVGETTWDTVQGKDVFQEETIEVLAYISGYSRRELSDDVQITDSRAVILLEELMGTDPKIDDIVDYHGKEYHVVSIISEPNHPTVELQLRSA